MAARHERFNDLRVHECHGHNAPPTKYFDTVMGMNVQRKHPEITVSIGINGMGRTANVAFCVLAVHACLKVTFNDETLKIR